jgi:hypothetical protein
MKFTGGWYKTPAFFFNIEVTAARVPKNATPLRRGVNPGSIEQAIHPATLSKLPSIDGRAAVSSQKNVPARVGLA